MRILAICLLATALAAGQSTIYIVDSNNDLLYSVDPATGAATTIGSTLPMGTPAGLAWDGTMLYALDLGGGGLSSLDTATGTPTSLGTTGLSGWQDITFDATTNSFLAVNQDDTLHRIDFAGNATLIGSTPAAYLLTAMTMSPQGVLYAIDFFGTGTFGILDPGTAAFTPIGNAVTGIQGMAWDPATNLIYAANTNDDSLYIIDPSTGAASLVGPHGNGVGFAKGLTVAGIAGCTATTYQINTVAAAMFVNGRDGTACSPHIARIPVGTSATIDLLTTATLPPSGWEAILDFGPLVPLGGGGITTIGGQIVNVNIFSPSLGFLWGGALPAFSGPVAASGMMSVPFIAPPTPLTITAQPAFLDPTAVDGFRLAQGAQLEVL